MPELRFLVRINDQWIEEKRYPLTLPFYRVGRGEFCEIYLDWWKGKSLSKVQFTLYQMMASIKAGMGYKMRDGEIKNPSTNGCYMKGRRVEGSIRLLHLDEVDIAKDLRFVYWSEEEQKEYEKISTSVEHTLSDNPKKLVNLVI